MKAEKIIIIEDEPDIVDVLSYNLSHEGYEVSSAPDGESGLAQIRAQLPDLVLLDLMLPGLDGIEVCRKLKGADSTRDIPIIMVTAKEEESDVVLGLGVGADDYVTKPFSPKEVVARVKAILRRGPVRGNEESLDRIMVGELSIDPVCHEVSVKGRQLELTPTEFRLLYHLASHPGRVFRRQDLLDSVVGKDAVVIDRTIDVHVNALRRKLGRNRGLIETVRGIGYKLKDTSR